MWMQQSEWECGQLCAYTVHTRIFVSKKNWTVLFWSYYEIHLYTFTLLNLVSNPLSWQVWYGLEFLQQLAWGMYNLRMHRALAWVCFQASTLFPRACRAKSERVDRQPYNSGWDLIEENQCSHNHPICRYEVAATPSYKPVECWTQKSETLPILLF